LQRDATAIEHPPPSRRARILRLLRGNHYITQGYFTYKKMHPPRTLPQAYA